MVNPVLEVVTFSQSREILPVNRPGHAGDMAVGDTVSRLVLRTPSGVLWSVVVPRDMFEELQSGLDVGDDVVPA